METELSDLNILQESTPVETRKPENPEATKAEKLPQILATLTGKKISGHFLIRIMMFVSTIAFKKLITTVRTLLNQLKHK